MGEMIEIKIPWGMFFIDERGESWWKPNYNIDLSPEEQFRINEKNGINDILKPADAQKPTSKPEKPSEDTHDPQN